MADSAPQPSGPPYLPQVAVPGLRPTISKDVAPSAVFLALYIGSAIGHQVTYQINRRRGHKFLMSWAMFGFSMARIGTMVLRIAWATRSDNVRLGIAALIFTNAGILVIYVVNLLLALRMLRATHPELGWSRVLGVGQHIFYVLLALALVLVISFVVVSYYTLDPGLRLAAVWVQRSAILIMLIFNLVGPALLFLCLFLRPSPNAENFGTGSIRSKMIVLWVAIFFTLFVAGFRTGTIFAPARPLSSPPWYDTRGAFYGIELGFEIIVTYWFLFTRFDRRFWVPNGSSKPGDYSSARSPLEPLKGKSSVESWEADEGYLETPKG